MATRFTTPLAAGVALALMAGPALAGQDAPFGGDAAVSDEALGAQRAFGTTDGIEIVVGSNNSNDGNVNNNRVCNNDCPVTGEKTINNNTAENGDGNQTANNTATFSGNPTFTNTLDNDAMSGVEGVGTAIQNNGSNTTISVETDVTITDTAGM